jgi:hypothetical protein
MNWGRISFKFTKEDLTRDYFVFDKLPYALPNSIIFLQAPNAYVIPFFSKDIRFVGTPYVLSSLNPNPTENSNINNLFRKQALSMLYSHISPLYILLGEQQYVSFREQYYTKYGISQNGKCQEFSSNVSTVGNLKLCPIIASSKFIN